MDNTNPTAIDFDALDERVTDVAVDTAIEYDVEANYERIRVLVDHAFDLGRRAQQVDTLRTLGLTA